MAPASGTLRGTGRRGSAAGGFALLLIALAPVMPLAFGDGEAETGVPGQIPPAVPIEAPALPQTPPIDVPAPETPAPPVAEQPPAPPADVPPPPAEAPAAEEPPPVPPAEETPPPVAEEPDPNAAPVPDEQPAVDEDVPPALELSESTASVDESDLAAAIIGELAQDAQSGPVSASDETLATEARELERLLESRATPRALVATDPLAQLSPKARARVKARAKAEIRRRVHRANVRRAAAVTPPARWMPASTEAAAVPVTAAPAAAAAAPASPEQSARQKTDKLDEPGLELVPVVFNALAETVAVIPVAIWGLLAALALLAALMMGLAFGRDRRARHLSRERDGLIADIEALEGAILPAVPEALGGLAMSISSTPAAGSIGGGDFHDAFALSRDRVAVLVGDVAGQGRQAVADAQLVRHAVRAYLEAGLDPRSAVAMTGAVIDDREEPLFASVVVAVHDRRDGTLTFATAGHEPPVFVTEQGAGLPPVSGWSPPFGTGLETGRRQTSIPLPEGTAVCLVTDGVVEARSDGERLGASRLIKWLSALGPGAMSSELMDRLRGEADTSEDDATICMLRALTATTSGAPRIEEAVVEGGDPTYLVRFLRDCGLPLADAEEAGEALAAAPDGTRMVASVEIRGGRAVVELAPLRGSSQAQFA